MNSMKMATRLSSIILLLLTIWSCTAQLPSYVSAGDKPTDATDYITWYNSIVESPQYDTVGVYEAPAFSDIRYVIIRSLNGDVLEVTRKSGAHLGFVCSECMWIDQVSFDQKGRIIGGLMDVTVKGGKMVVQYERCPECTFKPNFKGDL